MQIGGSEIIAPLRDTVRLVHHKHRDIHLGRARLEERGCKPLRRDIKQLVVAINGIVQSLVYLLICHSRIDRQRLYSPIVKVLHLVCYKSNQRRDNYADTLLCKRGNLETERFAAAGWHKHKGIPPLQNRLYNLLLVGTERAVSPVPLQNR